MGTGKVWLVTGTGRGTRLTLVRNLLKEGYRVAATTNDLNSLSSMVGEYDESRWLPILVSSRDKSSQGNAIQKTISHFGQIDEVVNDARFWKNMR